MDAAIIGLLIGVTATFITVIGIGFRGGFMMSRILTTLEAQSEINKTATTAVDKLSTQVTEIEKDVALHDQRIHTLEQNAGIA